MPKIAPYVLQYWNGKSWHTVDEGGWTYINEKLQERHEVFHDAKDYRIKLKSQVK